MLGAGYGAMVLLLIVSAFEAYRIQRSASQQTAEIYHNHVKQDDVLYRFRRILFLGAIGGRDFLLNRQSNRSSVYKVQLQQWKADAGRTLDELDQLPSPKPASSQLRAKTQEFWETLALIAEWNSETSASRGFDFIQQEITPRRNATGDLVRELTQANQEALKNSEAQFADSRRSATLRLLVMLGLCLVSGLAIAYLSLAYSENLERESMRQYEEVEQARRELEQLSARLLEIQEDERRRLSRELHDEIGQTLTALRIEISQAHSLTRTDTPAVRERLESARALAEKTLSTVRNIALLLRPSMLDDLGLGPALQWQAEDFSSRTGVPCEYSDGGLHDVLSDACKTCVYRVVQEALHNAEKHASASNVRVSISQQPTVLTVAIEDNGCGFDTDATARRPGSLGILGMRERAALLGGALTIVSPPGQGTRVKLSLPLAAEVPRQHPAEEVHA